jgi:hypothetical protein
MKVEVDRLTKAMKIDFKPRFLELGKGALLDLVWNKNTGRLILRSSKTQSHTNPGRAGKGHLANNVFQSITNQLL